MTANEANTLQDTSGRKNLHLEFRRGNKFKYDFPHNLNTLFLSKLGLV